MLFTIEWIESKQTSTGKTLAEARLRDADGNITEKATLWGSNWNPMPMSGTQVEGELKITQTGQYTNKTLYPPFKPKVGGTGGGMIKQAMQMKQEGIKSSQERKEIGIEISATFRDATLITIAQLTGQNFTNEEFHQRWLHWRTWLSEHYNDPASKEELNDIF